jgi:hypothetical protein
MAQDLEHSGKLNLPEYAQRLQGYQPRVQDGGHGIVVLDHPGLQDRVAMAQVRGGAWIYASVVDYAPRGPGEPADLALARLRECIGRSVARGSAADFVAHADRLRRTRTAELLGVLERGDPANRRMVDFWPVASPPVAPSFEQVAARKASFEQANRAVDARLPTGPRQGDGVRLDSVAGVRVADPKRELGMCRVDWGAQMRAPPDRDRGPARGR